MVYRRGWSRLRTPAHSAAEARTGRAPTTSAACLPAPAPLGQLTLVVQAQELPEVAVPGAGDDELEEVRGDAGYVETGAQGLAERNAGAVGEVDDLLGVQAGEREPFGYEPRAVGRPHAEGVPGFVGELSATGVEGEAPDLLLRSGQAEQPVPHEQRGERGRLGRAGRPLRAEPSEVRRMGPVTGDLLGDAPAGGGVTADVQQDPAADAAVRADRPRTLHLCFRLRFCLRLRQRGFLPVRTALAPRTPGGLRQGWDAPTAKIVGRAHYRPVTPCGHRV